MLRRILEKFFDYTINFNISEELKQYIESKGFYLNKKTPKYLKEWMFQTKDEEEYVYFRIRGRKFRITCYAKDDLIHTHALTPKGLEKKIREFLDKYVDYRPPFYNVE